MSSESSEVSTDDQEGSWVKVASNGQHVQEKRQANSKLSKLANGKTKPLASKSSESMSAERSGPKMAVAAVPQSRLGLDDFETDEATETKLTKDDLLVPNSIDEEELMFRRALEMSLKESEQKLVAAVVERAR